MKKLLAIFIGFGIGVVALSVVNTLLHLAFLPKLLSDGQYAFVYIFYVPEGAWLGALTGYGLAAVRTVNHRNVGVTQIVGSGIFLTATFLLLRDALTSDSSNFGDALESFFVYFGVAVLWTLALIIWGMVLIRGNPRKLSLE